jgi:hypothetical protein
MREAGADRAAADACSSSIAVGSLRLSETSASTAKERRGGREISARAAQQAAVQRLRQHARRRAEFVAQHGPQLLVDE